MIDLCPTCGRLPIDPPLRANLTLAERIVALCAEYGMMTVDQLCGPRRGRNIATHRMAAAYLMAEHCHHMSLPMIGKRLCRDHSTVIAARDKVEADLASGGERFGGLVRDAEHHLNLR